MMVGVMGLLPKGGLLQSATQLSVVLFFTLLVVRKMPSKTEEYNKGNVFSCEGRDHLLCSLRRCALNICFSSDCLSQQACQHSDHLLLQFDAQSGCQPGIREY